VCLYSIAISGRDGARILKAVDLVSAEKLLMLNVDSQNVEMRRNDQGLLGHMRVGKPMRPKRNIGWTSAPEKGLLLMS
jgi:hypothetical protein